MVMADSNDSKMSGHLVSPSLLGLLMLLNSTKIITSRESDSSHNGPGFSGFS